MRRSAILRKSGDRRMDDPAAGALDIARPPRLSLPLPPPSRVEAADAAPRPSGRNGRRRRGGGRRAEPPRERDRRFLKENARVHSQALTAAPCRRKFPSAAATRVCVPLCACV